MSLSETEVLAFLQANPAFLAQHADALNIRLPEEKILSFNQGKIAVLQQKTEHMAAQLAAILDDAEYNRHVLANLLSFNRRLLAVNTLSQFARAVRTGLDEDFSLPNNVLRIVIQAPPSAHVPVSIDGSDHIPLQNAVSAIKCVQCGTQIATALLDLLDTAVPMESFLQLPIVWHEQTLAILVVAHEQPDYFNPQLATDFVDSMAQSMATVLARLLRLSKS